MSPRGPIFAVLIAILPVLVQGQSQASNSSTAFNANRKLIDNRGGENVPQIRGSDLSLGRARKSLELDEISEGDTAKPHLRNAQDLKMLMEAMKSKGGVGDGGGDPRVFEFLEYGRKAVSWLIDTPHVELGVSEYELLLRIWEIFLSRGENTSRLQFPSVDEITCDEVPNEVSLKGCTHSDGSIVIAGNYWSRPSISKQEQCGLALTELLRPQKLRLIYQIAPQICERIGLKNEIQSVPKSGLANPFPRILSMVIESQSRNYDSTTDGLDTSTLPFTHVEQRLYDSPVNGAGHEWIEHLRGWTLYQVFYSSSRQERQAQRGIYYEGFLKIVKTYPKTIRFKGKISGDIGVIETVRLQNGTEQKIKHGILPGNCIVSGEFDFVEAPEKPGFYRLWELSLPFCDNDPKDPFINATRILTYRGKPTKGEMWGEIGFWMK